MHARLGSELSYSPESVLPFIAGGRYRVAFRMGGVRGGKKLGEQLMGAGAARDEAVMRIIDLLEHC
jgi:hypothetical protein